MRERSLNKSQTPTIHDGPSSRRWLTFITLEAAFANVFIVLTGGAFLTGMALMLGASDFEIGLLGAIPFMAHAFQLLSAYLVDRTGHRKVITVWSSVAGRQVWWLVIPLLFLGWRWNLNAFLAIFVLSSVSMMIASPAWMAWMADIVPPRIRGRYFGQRNNAVAVATALTAIVGGITLDRFRGMDREALGFGILVGTACLFAAVAVVLIARLPDRKASGGMVGLTISHFLEPLRDRNFRRLLKVFAVWNLAIGIAAPFFAVHMLNILEMSFTVIALYTTLTALVAISTNRIWGKLIDRFGSKPVIAVCALGISIVPLIWWIPRPDFLWILVFEGIYSASLWAGFNLAAFNVPIANSPRTRRTVYLAAFSVVTGFAFFAASIIGGAFAEWLSGFQWPIGWQVIVNYHFLFAISAGLRILAALLFLTFHEPKEKGIPVMVQFMGYAVLKRISLGRQIFPDLLRFSHIADPSARSDGGHDEIT